MVGIKSNEREFNGQVISWLNEFINRGSYPFEVATSDPSIKTLSDSTRFPDVALWLDRKAKTSFCFWELKTPVTAVDDKDLLEVAVKKANAINANYFVTWNMREAIIWRTPLKGQQITSKYRFKAYSALHIIISPDDLWDSEKKDQLRDRAKCILDDLARLYSKKHLPEIQTDSTFFVERLRSAIDQIGPDIGKAAHAQMGNKKFRSALLKWASEQGMPTLSVSQELCEVISKHALYRLLGKIIFYLALRRIRTELPPLSLKKVRNSQVAVKLRGYFEKARQIDYQAVFVEDITDEIPIPDGAAISLKNLIVDLNRFNFTEMPQDVIGNVFEKLIPEDQRHLLGQYFTSENLVDLIISFCVGNKADLILDPTCGTGTFLIRAYDRLKNLGSKKHNELLSQLWGIDIGSFPAELATISLYKQNLDEYDNFPRILSDDFFHINVGKNIEFPTPKPTGDPDNKIAVEMPAFDAIVGNFPYIRQELLEKTHKGYKGTISRIIQKEWAEDYPEIFNGGKIKLSGQADIFAYMFFHAGSMLKEGGRMGIVTSNSWLDVAYGYELQKFFLKNFKIIAIIESRCEPWFDDAAVNTVVTILERCRDRAECENNNVKFVKIKKRLQDLIEKPLEQSAERWWRLDKLIQEIETCDDAYFEKKGDKNINLLKGHGIHETDDFRIRFLKQADLQREVMESGTTAKWGRYLRAPEIYFQILDKCKDKLIPVKSLCDVRRGITTGINQFFFLTEDAIKHWEIEEDFIKPIVKTPREITGLSLDDFKSSTKIFICCKTKKELRMDGKLGALRYILWGEKQKKDNGDYWKDVPTVANRKLWYCIDKEPFAVFLTPGFVSERFFVPESKEPIFSSDVFFEWRPKRLQDIKTITAQLNSTFLHLQLEINGRANLGEGVLKIIGPELDSILIVDPKYLPKKIKESLHLNYKKIINRTIEPIFSEVKRKDRAELDCSVLEALGLDADKYLHSLYEGLIELVKERINLAKMRKTIKKNKIHHDIEKIKEEVIEEILPNGPKKFPEDFIDQKYLKNPHEISIPVSNIELGSTFFGKQEIIGDNDFKMEFDDIDNAIYVIYAHKHESYIVRLPHDKSAISRAIVDYEKYLANLMTDLLDVFAKRSTDYKLVQSLAEQIMKDFGLQIIKTETKPARKKKK